MPNYYMDPSTLENNTNSHTSSTIGYKKSTPDYPDKSTLETGDQEIDETEKTSREDSYLYRDIGSNIFNTETPEGTLSFQNLGIVHVDYMEMRRMTEKLKEINQTVTSTLGQLASALSALASLVGASIDISEFNMSSLGLESNFSWAEEDDFSGLSEVDSASNTYVLGICDNISNAIMIMNNQINMYQEQMELTENEIKSLNDMVEQILDNNNIYYTTIDGETKKITYNNLLNEYKEVERKTYQINNLLLYNPDGSINKDRINELEELLADEVNNKSGKFMTPSEGNELQYKQCTWWAYTRASQFLGENYPTNIGNGGDYFNNNIWFESSTTTPRPNSLIVYQNTGAGHVAYVEAIDYVNNKMYISHAGKSTDWYGISEIDIDGSWNGWKPQGYIYLDSPLENNTK